MNADGTGQVNLSRGGGTDFEPDWARGEFPFVATLGVVPQPLGAAIRGGAIRLSVGLSEPGRACSELSVGVRAARQGGLRPRRTVRRRGRVALGRRCVPFATGGTKTMTVRLTTRARGLLSNLLRARRDHTVVARVVAAASEGDRSTTTRRLPVEFEDSPVLG